MTAVTIAKRDLRTLMELGDPRQSVESVESVWECALSTINAVLPCDGVTLQIQDVGRRRVVALREWDGAYDVVDDPDLGDVEQYWSTFWSSQCSYPQRTGDYATITRASDQFGWPVASNAGGELTVSGTNCHEMMAPLPMVGSLDYRLMLWRGGRRDFCERDVLLLSFLRPHLVAIRDATFLPEPGTQELTSRQRQVLSLVASGLTNRQIARQLGVSEHTARKHLEKIFERLQVSSRTAAVARAFHESPQRRVVNARPATHLRPHR